MIHVQRRRRERLFGAGLFADPAWDLLLHLYTLPEVHGVSVSRACAGAAVPQTTALRWLQTLEAARLIERMPDPAGGRRPLLRLSRVAREQMTSYLRDLADRWPA